MKIEDFQLADSSELFNLTQMIKENPSVLTSLSETQLYNLTSQWRTILTNQRLLLDLHDKKILVVGDIHGDFHQLQRAIHMFDTKQVEMVLFNGDLIDRGSEMLECLFTLAARQILNPKKIFYLRGNHELQNINAIYGFRGFCTAVFGSRIYNEFSKCFQQLPLASKVGEWAFITHGGVPREKIYFHMMRLELKPKEPEKGPYWELIWNDPDKTIDKFISSYRGPHCYKFGRQAFDDFMDFHSLDLFVRAHQAYPMGYHWFFDERLLTVFSSQVGPYQSVTPHFAIINKGNVELVKAENIEI